MFCRVFWNASENLDRLFPTGFKALSRNYKGTLTWMVVSWAFVSPFRTFTGQGRSNNALSPRSHEICAITPVIQFAFMLQRLLYNRYFIRYTTVKSELNMVNGISLRSFTQSSIPSLQWNLRAVLNDWNLQRVFGMLLNECYQAFK